MVAKTGTINVAVKADARPFLAAMRKVQLSVDEALRVFGILGRIFNRRRIFPGADAIDFRFPSRPPSAWKPFRPYDHRGIV